MSDAGKTLPFQAEVRELLHLVIHSLYSHPEIFLRELISTPRMPATSCALKQRSTPPSTTVMVS